MKSIIIYYSQTGNTKKIAKAIHDGMNQLSEKCDIATPGELDPKKLIQYDLIGFGAPVWHQQEPMNISKFIKKMPLLKGKHSFTFCTHGLLLGLFIARMILALKERQLEVIGWKDWFGNYYNGPQPYFTHDHPDKIDLQEAKNFGRKILERSKKIFQGDRKLIPKLPNKKEYHKIYGVSTSEKPGGKKQLESFLNQNKPKLNKEKCKFPKCSICMKNCPTQCIDMAKSPLISYEHCDSCFFCSLLCPTGALETKFHSEVNDMEKVKMYYQNFAKDLLKYKTLRNFRCLIPENKLLQHKGLLMIEQHPRLIIRKGIGVLPSKIYSQFLDSLNGEP
ncbi:MAG: hypothetical protein GY710_02565 [Desulfobacteraceae bacterium]|nr:hypothetical protein [Desulfobacteraceae bacterium]